MHVDRFSVPPLESLHEIWRNKTKCRDILIVWLLLKVKEKQKRLREFESKVPSEIFETKERK
jgi:hypothetical protein